MYKIKYRGKHNDMEKTKSYLANVMFLLFYKGENDPCQVADIVSDAIREAIFTLYPRSRFENGIRQHRVCWYKKFLTTLINKLSKILEQMENLN
jgi:hypothetical protein